MVESVRALIKAAPDAVNIEDNEETTVIESAISTDAPYDAVRAIQKASERDWKARKMTSQPGETHMKIEEKLVMEQYQKQKKQEVDRLKLARSVLKKPKAKKYAASA